MKYAKDFRQEALKALNGKWGIAVGTCLLATILGGGGSNSFSFSNVDFSVDLEQLPFDYNTVLVVLIIVMIVRMLFFSIIQVGYSHFNLRLVDNEETSANLLFGYFKNWKNIICTFLLEFLYIFLCFLLLVIPAVIATYSYAMTSYILAENPELTAHEALSHSKEMMRGNKRRLFCLHLSFIGWELLCGLSLGIGYLWLKPYKHAATAAFYREISR